jgi:hypothetical protein
MRNNDSWENDWFPVQDPAGAVNDVQVQQTQVPQQGPEAVHAALIRKALAHNVMAKGGF